MEHELIDWYDKKGNHKGIIDKAIAHKKGLWHKSIHVWIINDNNEVLLQKRCSSKSFYPNYWDCSFSGHVGESESCITSAIREGKEEIGLEVKEKDLTYLFTIKEVLKWNNIVSKEFVEVYIMRKNVKIQNLIYQKEEVECAKYFKLKEIFSKHRNKDIFPHNKEYKKLSKILY